MSDNATTVYDPLMALGKLHEKFAWHVPSTFNFGSDVVDRWAADRPDLTALLWTNARGEERRFSYADIARLSCQCANLFSKYGLGKGDRILVILPRIPEWQIVLVACSRLGIVAVPCISMLSQSDIAYRIDHSGAAAVVIDLENLSKIPPRGDGILRFVSGGSDPDCIALDAMHTMPDSHIAAVVNSEEPAIMYYTSGSTGLPKGVTHAARAIFAWRVSAEYWLDLGPGDRMWCTADTGWSKAGTSVLFGPWSRGATVLFYDGPFDARTRFGLIEKYAVNCFCASATELRRLIQERPSQFDISSLRSVVSAGESVDADIFDAWFAMTGKMVRDGYGQTETLMTIVNQPDMPVKPGSMGAPLPGTDAGVLRADGQVGWNDCEGELVIKAPNPQLMLGYWRDGAYTASPIQDIGGSKWFRTGDEVKVDVEGYVFFRGRNDDIINTSGYRVGPQEVENALNTHPAIKESAVIGRPDPRRGEVIEAHVVLNDGFCASEALVEEIQEHVKSVTAPYKYPRRIAFTAALPKTSSGKIRRTELRKQRSST